MSKEFQILCSVRIEAGEAGEMLAVTQLGQLEHDGRGRSGLQTITRDTTRAQLNSPAPLESALISAARACYAAAERASHA